MDLNSILLIVAALAPAVALCIFIFIKDRVEKEPIGLLLLLLGLGAFICFPAAKIETVLTGGIDKLFSTLTYEYEGELYMNTTPYRFYLFSTNFIGIALVEEGLKFLVMFFITRNNKNFNSLFDGLIYAVFVSLGFAALENVLYVIQLGWQVAILRALMSVPGHMFFAVMMGYYYSMWHMFEKAHRYEKGLKNAGVIPQSVKEFSEIKYLALSLIVPIGIHGFYDYCCEYGSTYSTIALYALVIFLYIYCFRKVFKLSKGDMSDEAYSSALVLLKYPQLVDSLQARTAQDQTTADAAGPYIHLNQ